ncbi:MAG: hypothetical protein IT462_13875 [Planctomycetes bacterium]|nr:hypothetical protein [Planctomycetota bacterium]
MHEPAAIASVCICMAWHRKPVAWVLAVDGVLFVVLCFVIAEYWNNRRTRSLIPTVDLSISSELSFLPQQPKVSQSVQTQRMRPVSKVKLTWRAAQVTETADVLMTVKSRILPDRRDITEIRLKEVEMFDDDYPDFFETATSYADGWRNDGSGFGCVTSVACWSAGNGQMTVSLDCRWVSYEGIGGAVDWEQTVEIGTPYFIETNFGTVEISYRPYVRYAYPPYTTPRSH